jgi:hypothetical protein
VPGRGGGATTGGQRVRRKVAKAVVKSAKRLSDQVLGRFVKDRRRHACIGCGQRSLSRAARERNEEHAVEESQRLLYEERQLELERRQEHERRLDELRELEQQRAEERQVLEAQIKKQEQETDARRKDAQVDRRGED